MTKGKVKQIEVSYGIKRPIAKYSSEFLSVTLTKEVEARNDELATQAAKLRVNIHKNWTSQAQKVIGQIRQTNSRLQERIRDIQETIKKAEKFVKALGYIDDLIDIAKKVIAAMS